MNEIKPHVNQIAMCICVSCAVFLFIWHVCVFQIKHLVEKKGSLINDFWKIHMKTRKCPHCG